jgi:hypothetical protein
MHIEHFTGDNHHNNLFLIGIGIISNILGHILPEQLGVFVQLLGILASALAIINYVFIFIDRFKKWKKNR